MNFYKKDKLIFISHYNRYVKYKNLYVDYHKKIPDPFFNDNICSTGLCRNTKINSFQNKIYNYYNRWWKKNIYIIFYWNTKSNYLSITLIFKVLRSKIFKTHDYVLNYYWRDFFPNLIYIDKNMSKNDFSHYFKRKKQPFIIWKPYKLNKINWKKLPKRYLKGLNENEKMSTWKWIYWNIDIFVKNIK